MTLLQPNVPLAPYTYYKIGGPSLWFTAPSTIEELQEVASFIAQKKLPYLILGAGSNVLINDAGFAGVVLHTGKLDRSLTHTENVLTKTLVSAGVSVTVAQLLRYCGTHGLGGLEFLVGVPGNVGGVLYMNAGTKTGEASHALVEVTTFDLKTGRLNVRTQHQTQYAYRTQQYLGPHELIIKGVFQTTPTEKKQTQALIQSMLTARKSAQPIDKPSCGSVFKNPPGKQAWQLIDQAGLRGKTIGGAQVSEMHTNFIINLGNAKSQDVQDLIAEIKTTVQKQFGLLLEEEVKIIPHQGLKTLVNP